MQAKLPDAFRSQMNELLGPETNLFLKSYEAPRTYGLRINPLKTSTDSPIMAHVTERFRLEPVPWCATGYYYAPDTRPGKHPYYAAGLYYIQEPSAMRPAELLDPQPGEAILDLAAAPGGKTTQIAGKMAGRGVLVANEIHPARAKILSENVERCGAANVIVTNAAPDELSARLPAAFDRIMLDAPCSGEGMFRKDEQAIAEWSPEHVNLCAARQSSILDHAAVMLRPGGRLVYSTCTFNRKENEEVVEAFCAKYPDFSIRLIERIWPQRERGEGHFAAVLQRKGVDDTPAPTRADHLEAGRHGARFERLPGTSAGRPDNGKRSASMRKSPPHRTQNHSGLAGGMELFRTFAESALIGGLKLGPGMPLRFGDSLYWLPQTDQGGPITQDKLQGLKVARPGLHLGDIRKRRLEPAHALALAVRPEAAAWVQSYGADSPEVAAFLRGETIPARETAAGWGLVAADGMPLGWGKASGGQIKNHLPKGLRRLG